MIHRSSFFRRIEDALLVLVPCFVLVVKSPPTWLWLLAASGVLVFAWGVFTLNFPREVDLDENGIRFRAYGREHAYAWEKCRVRVRKFLVKDRVLVRVQDLATGRSHAYWLVAHLSKFRELVASIEARKSA